MEASWFSLCFRACGAPNRAINSVDYTGTQAVKVSFWSESLVFLLRNVLQVVAVLRQPQTSFRKVSARVSNVCHWFAMGR